MKTEKLYTLWVHWKQGDEFNGHLENTKTVSDAFNSWANRFRENVEVCNVLAKAFKDCNVEVCADTHHIGFYPLDDNAEKLLADLAAKEFLHVDELECEDDEDFDVTDEDDKKTV